MSPCRNVTLSAQGSTYRVSRSLGGTMSKQMTRWPRLAKVLTMLLPTNPVPPVTSWALGSPSSVLALTGYYLRTIGQKLAPLPSAAFTSPDWYLSPGDRYAYNGADQSHHNPVAILSAPSLG